MTFTVISNLNTSTLTSLLGKQLINVNTQGKQKMAKFVISIYKVIFGLFHILCSTTIANVWIRKGNVSQYVVEDTNSSTTTVMLCKNAYFTLTSTKASLSLVIHLMWIFQAKQLGMLRFNLFWPLISYRNMLIA